MPALMGIPDKVPHRNPAVEAVQGCHGILAAGRLWAKKSWMQPGKEINAAVGYDDVD